MRLRHPEKSQGEPPPEPPRRYSISETVGRLLRIVGIIEPSLTVEQELVGVSPGREVHRWRLPVSGFNGDGSDCLGAQPNSSLPNALSEQCSSVFERRLTL